MRRTTIAAATAAGLVLLSGTATAAPPANDRAVDECENQKPKAQNPDGGDCDY